MTTCQVCGGTPSQIITVLAMRDRENPREDLIVCKRCGDLLATPPLAAERAHDKGAATVKAALLKAGYTE